MKPAIRVENLSKLYHVGARQPGGYRTLRETIMDAAAVPWRKVRALSRRRGARKDALEGETADSMWALRDVSLAIAPGAVVGVIGRNGAGKSTLLKIMSRITEPTDGRIRVRGRVGSLLEVGTGFHHELSGRENIYLNGAILGMSRREIQRKFDEIVAFAEIDRHLDTPVKRYSSGMYVRLAFAVASHLEPEILLVDEVLAVGDHAFQKKCLGKMNDVSKTGRTVLLVSHNMATIVNLCEQVAVLERGRLAYFGECEEGVKRYMKSCAGPEGGQVDLAEHRNRRLGSKPILRHVRLLNDVGETQEQFRCGDPMTIEVDVDPAGQPSNLHLGVVFEDAFGSKLFTIGTYLTDSVLDPMTRPTRIRGRVNELPLAPGRYALSLTAGPVCQFGADTVDEAVWFDVVETDYYGNGRLPEAHRGRFLVHSQWEAEAMTDLPCAEAAG